jgi:hypothetical protein
VHDATDTTGGSKLLLKSPRRQTVRQTASLSKARLATVVRCVDLKSHLACTNSRRSNIFNLSASCGQTGPQKAQKPHKKELRSFVTFVPFCG